MSDTAWICTPSIYAGYARPFANSFFGTDLQKQSVEWGERNWSGEPLPATCFPAEIFATKDVPQKLPHLFSEANFWVISGAVREVLAGFDLGNGAVYAVRVLQVDRRTPVGGEWFCITFGNRKDGILADQSVKMYDTYVYGGTKAWMPKASMQDGDIALSEAVIGGPDIWKDPCVADAFFLSDALGKALIKAKLEKAFHMHACRIMYGA